MKYRTVFLFAGLLLAGLLLTTLAGSASLFEAAPQPPLAENGPGSDAGPADAGLGALHRPRVEFSERFSAALRDNTRHMSPDHGLWNASCACRAECFEEGRRARAALGHPRRWVPARLRQLREDMVRPWRATGIRLDHHVNMVTCAYHTRTRWNPSGLWLHLSGRNVTSLRTMPDSFQRTMRIRRYIEKVLREAPRPLRRPLVAYVSVADIPCNPNVPYLLFFVRRGVRGIAIPDDTFVGGGMQKDWETVRRDLAPARRVPYLEREDKLFFRGSPTHKMRQGAMETLAQCCPNRSDVLLAVMERKEFRHLRVPLKKHADYRHVLAIRGRTAASRDKYLLLLNSTVVWVHDEAVDDPWFQFYHALWKPWVNYVPMRLSTAKCTSRLLSEHPHEAADIASASAELGAFLTQDLVDAETFAVLEDYAAAQEYDVPEDPVEFLQAFRHVVKRKTFKGTQVMPDDRNPVKFVFHRWIARRIAQMLACRSNSSNRFSYHNPKGCYYL